MRLRVVRVDHGVAVATDRLEQPPGGARIAPTAIDRQDTETGRRQRAMQRRAGEHGDRIALAAVQGLGNLTHPDIDAALAPGERHDQDAGAILGDKRWRRRQTPSPRMNATPWASTVASGSAKPKTLASYSTDSAPW